MKWKKKKGFCDPAPVFVPVYCQNYIVSIKVGLKKVNPLKELQDIRQVLKAWFEFIKLAYKQCKERTVELITNWSRL